MIRHAIEVWLALFVFFGFGSLIGWLVFRRIDRSDFSFDQREVAASMARRWRRDREAAEPRQVVARLELQEAGRTPLPRRSLVVPAVRGVDPSDLRERLTGQGSRWLRKGRPKPFTDDLPASSPTVLPAMAFAARPEGAEPAAEPANLLPVLAVAPDDWDDKLADGTDDSESDAAGSAGAAATAAASDRRSPRARMSPDLEAVERAADEPEPDVLRAPRSDFVPIVTGYSGDEPEGHVHTTTEAAVAGGVPLDEVPPGPPVPATPTMAEPATVTMAPAAVMPSLPSAAAPSSPPVPASDPFRAGDDSVTWTDEPEFDAPPPNLPALLPATGHSLIPVAVDDFWSEGDWEEALSPAAIDGTEPEAGLPVPAGLIVLDGADAADLLAAVARADAASASTTGRRPRPLEPGAGEDDNLKRIKGVGPGFERRLKQIGVRRFDQIAAWSAAEQQWVDDFLGFPQRVERDGWVEQAALLAAHDRRSDDGADQPRVMSSISSSSGLPNSAR